MANFFLNPNYVPEALMKNIMVSEDHMKIVWNNLVHTHRTSADADVEPKFYIGNITGSEKLKQQIKSGKLDSFFSDLGRCYRDVFASSPWNEYVVCDNPSCHQAVGSDYFFGKLSESYDLRQIERVMAVNPEEVRCPVCGHKGMSFFHDRETIAEKFKKEFSNDVSASMYFTAAGKLIGFSHSWFDTPKNLWNYAIKDFFVHHTPDIDVSECYGLENGEEDSTFLFWSDWGVDKHHRNSPGSIWLIEKLMSQNVAKAASRGSTDMEIIGVTMEDSNAIRIHSRMGAYVTHRDEPSGVVAIRNPLRNTHAGALEMAEKITRFANRPRKRKVA